jgi:hypothetical protein
MYVGVYVCNYVCMCVCVYACICIYVFIYVCKRICVLKIRLLFQACFTRNLCLHISVTSCKCFSEDPDSQLSPFLERRQFHMNGGIEVGDESV